MQARSGSCSEGGADARFGGTVNTATFASILIARCGSVLPGGPIPMPSVAGPTPCSTIFPNQQVPRQCFDPTAVALLNQFVPLPNAPNGQFRSVPVYRTRADQFSGRFDHKISNN